MDKFRGVYRIASARAAFWNYGWNAAYFVTIVTKNRIHWFGDVVDGEMVLSEVGGMAHRCWLEIPDHFPFVTLDAFVVMPDHIHGIVVIQKPDDGRTNDPNDVHNPRRTQNRFGPQSHNLASVIRGFKIGVTQNARRIYSEFAWQARYHDRIIRDSFALGRIAAYIRRNPAEWR